MVKFSREKLFLPVGPFETERLILRPLGLEHEEAIWKMLSDPDFVRFIPFELATDREAAKKLFYDQIKDGKRYKFHLGVEWNDPPDQGDKTLGFAMFRPTEDGEKIEIGYSVVPRHWGKGLGTEITQVLANEIAKQMGVSKQHLVANIEPENIGSIKVANKCGFIIFGENTLDERPNLILHWQG